MINQMHPNLFINLAIIVAATLVAYATNEALVLIASLHCLSQMPVFQPMITSEDEEGDFETDDKDYEPKIGFTAKS